VYRTLRSVNPSPYLYYFDYGYFRIFGSSPEAQIVIKAGKAEIHPIAGTFKRTGDYTHDLERAEELKKDPKENSEHVMLVDLARNDLSIHAREVHVKKYKEIQFFSHVIHLTSVVEGTLKDKDKALDVFANTFPAGTLSGAPKFKAMQIIDKLESTKRGFYGGAIGMLGLNGDINHAILIRSFLAIDKTLRYQAGAGIVIDSDPQKELEEVNNKLAALKAAIKIMAEQKKIVIIDNYDSFTYNLVHAIEDIVGYEIDVFRNDAISVEEIGRYDYIFISPGPGLPEDSGITLDVISKYYQTKKIFGVCLGLQSIVTALGGKLDNLDQVYHGVDTEMKVVENCPIYSGIDNTFIAGRYHSWVAHKNDIPQDLVVNCLDDKNEVMGIHHKDFPVYAVQFHPESILTPDGNTMIENFLMLENEEDIKSPIRT